MSLPIVLLLIALQSPPNQNLDFWVTQLKNPSVDLRINALQKLAEIRDLDAIRAVASALNSENPEVRFQAARSLSKLPSERSMEALAERAREEKDVYVKGEINRSLRSMKDYFENLEREKENQPSE